MGAERGSAPARGCVVVEIDSQAIVQVGSTVRFRSVRAVAERRVPTSVRLNGDRHGGEHEITIVASDADAGLYRLTLRSPMARALLGHRVGDVVEVRLEQTRAELEVTAVNTPQACQPDQVGQQGDGVVRVGSLVRVRDGELLEWWRIVASHDADAMKRCISEETPVARALLGRRLGDHVVTEGPNGRWTVTILAVDSEGVWE